MRDTKQPRTPLQLALIAFRERLNLTQQQFSDIMGVTVVSVCRWETSRPPSGYALAELTYMANRLGDTRAAEVFEDALKQDFLGKRRSRFLSEFWRPATG